MLITHRPNILQQMDKILVLVDGAVKSFGSRDEVMAEARRPRVVVGDRP